METARIESFAEFINVRLYHLARPLLVCGGYQLEVAAGCSPHAQHGVVFAHGIVQVKLSHSFILPSNHP